MYALRKGATLASLKDIKIWEIEEVLQVNFEREYKYKYKYYLFFNKTYSLILTEKFGKGGKICSLIAYLSVYFNCLLQMRTLHQNLSSMGQALFCLVVYFCATDI